MNLGRHEGRTLFSSGRPIGGSDQSLVTSQLLHIEGVATTAGMQDAKGFMYLVAIIDWHSRKVLSWRLSNTMGADFCVSALTGALASYGLPEIFKSDQSSQSVHQLAIHLDTGLSQCRHLHGRPEQSYRQRLRREIVADHKVRAHLPKSRFHWHRTQRRAGQIDRILQFRTAP